MKWVKWEGYAGRGENVNEHDTVWVLTMACLGWSLGQEYYRQGWKGWPGTRSQRALDQAEVLGLYSGVIWNLQSISFLRKIFTEV